MSRLKEKAVKAKAEGSSMSDIVDSETRELQGERGGLDVLSKQSRGGADGGAGGYAGQKLQLPWSEKVAELLCRRNKPVSANAPEWASLICEDITGGYLVAVSIRRFSESYQYKDPDRDEMATIKTCFDSHDPAPSHFKGGTDRQALLNFLDYVGGRTIELKSIKTIERTVGDSTFQQKVWDYKVLDEKRDDTLISVLENWDNATSEEKSAAAGAISETGVTVKETKEKLEGDKK